MPHPAYHLSWARVSCLACIFGQADQWVSVRPIAPDLFNGIAQYERLQRQPESLWIYRAGRICTTIAASNCRPRERLTGGEDRERASSASRWSSSLSLSGRGSAERRTALA